jgi:FkbM family methyltransferase
MKKLIRTFIGVYLWPLRWSNRLALYVKGLILRYDEHLLATVDLINRRFPKDNGLLIDIGAYNGDSATCLARLLPNNKVWAFEPNPALFNEAVDLCKRKGNIHVFNLGFSNKAGETDFYLTKHAVSSSLLQPLPNPEIEYDSKIKVSIETLDQYFKNVQNILLLKLDAQGAELRILEAGEQTLRKTKLILTEMLNSKMYDGGCQYFHVDDILRKQEFVLYSIFTSYNHEGTKYFDALYINQNFLN